MRLIISLICVDADAARRWLINHAIARPDDVKDADEPA